MTKLERLKGAALELNATAVDLVAGALSWLARRKMVVALLSMLSALAVVAATTNPLQLWFTQTGTGAVKRPMYSKLSDSVSVKDFGAVGNGVTDDSTAVANALAASGSNQMIDFACPGTYKTTAYGTLPCGDYYPPMAGAIGAFPRSLPTKILDIVDVKDFGAKGDGVTNDSTAIQAAITALATGGTLLFPSGNYKANIRVTASNISLLGHGKSSIITAAVNTSPVIDLTSDVTTGQLRGIGISNLKLVGTGNAGIGIRMQAVSPYVVEGSSVKDIYFSALGNALSMVTGGAFETYQNYFASLNSDTTSGDAFSVDGIYNTFISIKAANCSARSWLDAGWSTTLIGLDSDGVVRYTGQNAKYFSITMETIFGTGPGAAGAVQLAGFNSEVHGITITNVAHAKANYGVEANNGPHSLSSVRVTASSNDDAHRPQYPFSLAVGSTGAITDATAPGQFTLEQAMPASTLVGWTLAGDLTGVSTAGKAFFKAQRFIATISADRGDTSQTLTPGTDEQTQRWASALTANRTITLSTTAAVAGTTFRVVRTGLGAFTLDVGGLKTIPISTAAFVDVTYSGSAWVLTGYGTL